MGYLDQLDRAPGRLLFRTCQHWMSNPLSGCGGKSVSSRDSGLWFYGAASGGPCRSSIETPLEADY